MVIIYHFTVLQFAFHLLKLTQLVALVAPRVDGIEYSNKKIEAKESISVGMEILINSNLL